MSAMEDNEEKLEELMKDEGRWTETYRRRVEALLGSIRDHRRTRQGAGGGGGNCPPNFGQNSRENLGKARRKKIMCKISGKSTSLPPLTEESPYAHVRDPENTLTYLDTLELQSEDMSQAHEYLQETYTQLKSYV